MHYHILLYIHQDLWLHLFAIHVYHIPCFVICLMLLFWLEVQLHLSQNLILFVLNFFLITILVAVLMLYLMVLQHLVFLFVAMILHPCNLQLSKFFFWFLDFFLQHLIQINFYLYYIQYFQVNLYI